MSREGELRVSLGSDAISPGASISLAGGSTTPSFTSRNNPDITGTDGTPLKAASQASALSNADLTAVAKLALLSMAAANESLVKSSSKPNSFLKSA